LYARPIVTSRSALVFRLVARAAAGLVATAALVAPARAQEVLRGPYPFRNEYTLSLRGGYGFGPGDAPSGVTARVGFGFQLQGGLWLDLEVGGLTGSCAPAMPTERCTPTTGKLADVLAGVSYKLQMDVPVVPHARVVAGPLYAFPDGAPNALGLALRVGVGATYYLYEWLGFGAELSLLAGRAGYDDDLGISNGVTVLDATVGAELAF
jgi:hypothetical protein